MVFRNFSPKLQKLLKERGHVFTASPVLVSSDFESISKTKLAVETLKKIGLDAELKRCEKKKVRSGVGKRRGRKYRKKKGPAIIVSKDCNAVRACSKIPGIDICSTDELTTEILAPGSQAGRLLVITEDALKNMEKW